MSSLRNIKLYHVGKTYDMEIDLDSSYEDFTFQIYSLTDIPPENQKILGLVKAGTLTKDIKLNSLTVVNGQKIIVVGKQQTTPSSDTSVSNNNMNNNTITNNKIKEKCKNYVWQEECSRIYVGEKVSQPIYKSKLGKFICHACSKTCFQLDQVEGIMDEEFQFSCECSSDWSRECLYVQRLNSVDLEDESKDNLLKSMRNYQLSQYIKRPAQSPEQKLKQHLSGFPETSLTALIESNYKRVQRYEDKTLQAKALSLLPKSVLFNRKNERIAPGEEQLRELLHWFKYDFFKWVDQPNCSTCDGPTQASGSGQPSLDEIMFEAGRVEIYQCRQWHTTRFPRYNHPGKLLETKRGRCGEWANAFTLICRALGYQTRYVLDLTDHVWTEVYVNDKWTHLDSCEASMDAPLTYEQGWNKTLSYVFAFERDGAFDVTKRYTIKYNQLPRDKMKDSDLENYLQQFNSFIQSRLVVPDRNSLLKRLESERLELLQSQKRIPKGQDMLSRISGSADWKNERGENGKVGQTTTVEKESQPVIKEKGFFYSGSVNEQNDLQFVGSSKALAGTSYIQLTPNETDKVGGVWLKKLWNVEQDWTCNFAFKIDKSGADGMAFVIQNHASTILGQGGSGLGYEGIENSIAIEFDTYASVDRCQDPNGNHVSIHCNGHNKNSSHHRYSLACTYPVGNQPMNDGKEHHCSIVYQQGSISIWLDGYFILSQLSLNIPKLLDLENGKDAFIGFTAATGGLKQSHIITYFQIGK
ncbi:hypothetical protein DLAC_04945 [Tieghemostelium lacteum]|uniref:Transglutaminase-like domain-containing protein n=1 Tax=Tieghemostelium lacteum TaxID=361077 RepID=A0A151ZI98_TIELA|nr:hypothetical protein DLAC_04945 [Tieghemostelium lacteum]|eukprot:KYQ93574.1 hypothetical protein DLAC_04945 [Tieghemostelium lacteum]